MTKHFVAVALAATLWIPEAAAQIVLQKDDWHVRTFTTYLPAPANSVPWLNLDRRNNWPKADFPIGREVNVAGPVVIGPTAPDMPVTANSPSNGWRM
jgi:hypothetical protein